MTDQPQWRYPSDGHPPSASLPTWAIYIGKSGRCCNPNPHVEHASNIGDPPEDAYWVHCPGDYESRPHI